MNERKPFQVGDKVDYHAIIGGPVTSTGHVIEVLGSSSGVRVGGREVAWISGKSGCVAVAALTHYEAPHE